MVSFYTSSYSLSVISVIKATADVYGKQVLCHYSLFFKVLEKIMFFKNEAILDCGISFTTCGISFTMICHILDFFVSVMVIWFLALKYAKF
jgi:hypothetical protein